MVSVPYSEFLKSVDANNVDAVWIDGSRIMWRTRPSASLSHTEPTSADGSATHRQSTGEVAYATMKPSDVSTPYEKLIQNDVVFGSPDKSQQAQQPGPGGSLAVLALYAFLVLAFLGRLPLPMRRRFGSGGSARFTLDHEQQPEESQSLAKMTDVAGVDDAKDELVEVIDCLKDPMRFARVGARPPKGILLCGPPGTGKTLLARAVAGEANVPFEACSASNFIELFVGTGAARVREMFKRARQRAPAVIFIDELDAIGKSRGGGGGARGSVSNDEREQTLNQMLCEMDGFEASERPVIVIAATNRADTLDSALTRPGRFDRTVQVELPDQSGRVAILNQHLHSKNIPLAHDVSVQTVAQRSQGMSGASLATLVNEAALLAAREYAVEVTQYHFDTAVLRTIAGIEKKSDALRGRERVTVARHEAGHAVLSAAVYKARQKLHRNHQSQPPESEEVHSGELPEHVSIIARQGGALGFTHTPAEEERKLAFEEDINARLAVLLGGRAAEQACEGSLSSGATDDIAQATRMCYQYAAVLGLSERVGPLSVPLLDTGGGGEDASAPLGGSARALTAQVEESARHVISTAMDASIDTVQHNMEALLALSKQLEHDGRVSGEHLRSFLSGVSPPDTLCSFIATSLVNSNNATRLHDEPYYKQMPLHENQLKTRE